MYRKEVPRFRQSAGEVLLACHCQEVPDTLPSGSLKVAVRAVPTRGDVGGDRLTLPASSALVTVTVTLRLDDAGSARLSVATTFKV